MHIDDQRLYQVCFRLFLEFYLFPHTTSPSHNLSLTQPLPHTTSPSHNLSGQMLKLEDRVYTLYSVNKYFFKIWFDSEKGYTK